MYNYKKQSTRRISMKLLSAALIFIAMSAYAEMSHPPKSVYVPSGLYYQKLSFSELRGVQINAKNKTAQWVERSCDVVMNKCSETRSKPLPITYSTFDITMPTGSEEDPDQSISFQYDKDEPNTLFHPSLGSFVKAPEILKPIQVKLK